MSDRARRWLIQFLAMAVGFAIGFLVVRQIRTADGNDASPPTARSAEP